LPKFFTWPEGGRNTAVARIRTMMDRRQFCAGLGALAADPAAWAGSSDERWHDAARSRDVPVRLRWPAGEGGCALVVFSHGLGGNLDAGTVWAEAWQAAGFAVLNLQHPGSDTEALRSGRLREAASTEQYLARIADARFVLDEIERRAAGGAPWSRIRLDAIGFAGHSFGARLTQAIAGERPAGAAAAAARLHDPRPRAFIAFSPGFNAKAGIDEAQVQQRFGAIERPFLCVTGSLDGAMIVGDADQATRRAVYRGLPPGAKAELMLDGADHATFGGQGGLGRSRFAARLLRREARAIELEARHHEFVARITSDWWRWRLLGDRAAQERLRAPAGLAEGDRWQLG
jgi:predicted dienelactone hydrolase